MKKINRTSAGQKRRHPYFEKALGTWDDSLKLYALASETERFWDELNAKLFLMRYELVKTLASLELGTKKYFQTKEELKRVELLYQDVLHQIRFTSSYSGRGDNPFFVEEEWENKP
jgi:hypothetical protein